MGSHPIESLERMRYRMVRLTGYALFIGVPTAIGAVLFAVYGADPTTPAGVFGVAFVMLPWPMVTDGPIRLVNYHLGHADRSVRFLLTSATVRTALGGLPLAGGLLMGGLWEVIGGYAAAGCVLMALSDVAVALSEGVVDKLFGTPSPAATGASSDHWEGRSQ